MCWWSCWILLVAALHSNAGMRLSSVIQHPINTNSEEVRSQHSENAVKNNVICEDIHGNVYIYAIVKESLQPSKITGVNGKQVNIEVHKNGGNVNVEVVKYIAEVLGVKKQDVLLTKGFFTDDKVLMVDKSPLTATEVETKFRANIQQ